MKFSISKVQASPIKNRKSATRNTQLVLFKNTDESVNLGVNMGGGGGGR
jgi:hypothetical protein